METVPIITTIVSVLFSSFGTALALYKFVIERKEKERDDQDKKIEGYVKDLKHQISIMDANVIDTTKELIMFGKEFEGVKKDVHHLDNNFREFKADMRTTVSQHGLTISDISHAVHRMKEKPNG